MGGPWRPPEERPKPRELWTVLRNGIPWGQRIYTNEKLALKEAEKQNTYAHMRQVPDLFTVDRCGEWTRGSYQIFYKLEEI